MDELGEDPKKPLLRLGEVMRWTGLTEPQIRKFVDAGVLNPVQYEGCRRLYRRKEIKERFGI
jgi:DNA-binding transcriptional MerR regulator